MYKPNPTKDLQYKDENVTRSCGGYFLHDDAGRNWRWLTPEETQTYEAAHDLARHDDDGHGMAIGSKPAVEDDNDLGADWGKAAATPSAIVKAYEDNIPTVVSITGPDAKSQLGSVFEVARRMLDESEKAPGAKRFIMLSFDFEVTNQETWEGKPTGKVTTIGTASETLLMDYADAKAQQDFFEWAKEAGLDEATLGGSTLDID